MALGNRIKPTAVYPADERITELEKENEVLKMQFKEDHNKDEVLKEDYGNIENQYSEVTKYIDTFKHFLQYINDDAEYINLNGYKRDEQLKGEIRDAIQNILR